MPGDWIKMRVDIHDQPEVIGIARRNGLNADAVVGKLVRIWGWADRITEDGHIPHVNRDYIDRLVQRKGFADAMAFVGWLADDGGIVVIPHFDRHNGESAKKRARDAERQRSVRILSQKKCDTTRTERGPEKRREDKNQIQEPPNPPPGGVSEIPIPDSLNTPAFAEAWASFVQHSKEKRVKRTPTGTVALLKKLAEFGPQVAAAKLLDAVANGWTGVIFPEDSRRGQPGPGLGPTSRVRAPAGKYDGIARKVHVSAPAPDGAGDPPEEPPGQAAAADHDPG